MAVIIEKEQMPDKKEDYGYGLHQFNLLLQTIKGHFIDLEEYGISASFHIVSKSRFSTELQKLNKKYRPDEIVTDYVVDPEYAYQTGEIKKVFPDCEIMSTFTLLDWREKENRKVLETFFKKSRPYSKLTTIKNHIVTKMKRKYNVGIFKSRGKPTKNDIKDIESCLKKVQAEMSKKGMRVHMFGHPDCKASYDQQVRDHAVKNIRLIDGANWEKPKTIIGLDWDYKSDRPQGNTSQLSPYLSIGSLSPKFFWDSIRNGKTSVESAKGQLLWREAFNAVGVAGNLGINKFWSDSPGFYVDDFDWVVDKKDLTDWKKGRLDDSDDVNESMKQLWENGWIHHLRRHVVADTLVRGYLGQHWINGQNWFRQTLLDHDAAVNRCNWMWLAAVAFSSKQKVYNYSRRDYVQRGTPDSKTVNRTFSCPS